LLVVGISKYAHFIIVMRYFNDALTLTE
jgi:hypothetical protein